MASSGWILQLVFPASFQGRDLEPYALLLPLLGALLSGPQWNGISPRRQWPAIASGLLLFGLPSLLAPVAGHGLPAFTRVALLALVPTCVAVITCSRESSRFDLLALLGPALAGLGGVFLILPASPELLLAKPLSAAAMAATILSIAIGSYTAHAATRTLPLRSSLILLLAPSLVVRAAAAMLTQRALSMPAIADTPALLWGAAETALLVFLLKAAPPIVLSTRFLLIPLLTTIEGFVLLKPSITLRLLFGITCLAVSTAILIRSSASHPDSPASLLG